MLKYIYIGLGSLSLGAGIIGIFLPLLPTTPFLLLSAALYFRSSPRLYNWLLSHKHLGKYIKNFREKGVIPLHAKIISLLMLWFSLAYCAFFVIPVLLWQFVFLAIALGVSTYILSFKSASE